MSIRNDIRPRRRPTQPPAKGSRVRLDGTGQALHRRRPDSLRETTLLERPTRPEPFRPEARPAPLARRTPGWQILLRGAVLTALVLGLAIQVRGEGRTIQGNIAAQATAAKEALTGARTAFAKGDLTAAEDQLGIAEHSLHNANRSVASLGQQGGVPFTPVSGDRGTAVELLSTGERFVGTARDLTRRIRTIPDAAASDNKGFYAVGKILNDRLPGITDDLSTLDRELELLSVLADRAADSDLAELKGAGEEFRRIVPEAKQALASGREVTDQLPGMLGDPEFRRYLLWFQNPAELRPTGGFVGTLGVLTLDRGAVKELNVDSIYAVANQANRTIKDPPPPPFRRFAKPGQEIWGLQDTNWSPDFPTAAERFQRYYEQGGGSTTDGVVAVTVTPVEELLKILGPVELPQYGYTFTAANFQETVQQDQAQRAVAADRDPKKLLRDFVPALLKKLGTAPADQRTQALAKLAESAKSGDLQVFFTREDDEDLLSDSKITGRYTASPGTIGLVDANIAGFKSSRDITTTLERRVKVSRRGEVAESLTVERVHSGATDEHDNLNYTRIYLPKDARVGDSDGWTPETLATDLPDWGPVLGGWTDVARFFSTGYTADFRHSDGVDLDSGSLPLRYLAQPGTKVNVRTTVTLPPGYVWQGRPDAVVEGRRMTLTGTARGDLVYDLKFAQN